MQVSPLLTVSLAVGMVATTVFVVVALVATAAVVEATGTVVGVGALVDVSMVNIRKWRRHAR